MGLLLLLGDESEIDYPPVGEGVEGLLLEDGTSFLLLEDDDFLLLE